MHGYGISQMIRGRSNDLLQVETGSLYSAPHRLERQRWIAAGWTKSQNNQRVREYRLTARGRKPLAAERSKWEQLTEVMGHLLGNPEEGTA